MGTIEHLINMVLFYNAGINDYNDNSFAQTWSGKMGKKFLIVVSAIFLLIVVAFLVLPQFVKHSSAPKDARAADEFFSIYNYLEDKEFSTAKIEGLTLVLKDKDQNTIDEYNLERKVKSKLLYIENRNTSMIFWTSGFDDLDGIMFMKSGWTDETWNGLMRVKKISGSAYSVATY